MSHSDQAVAENYVAYWTGNWGTQASYTRWFIIRLSLLVFVNSKAEEPLTN